MIKDFTIIDGIILSIAVLGAVLGVLNTFRNFDRDRVKLKVIPKQAFPVGTSFDDRVRLCINVTNLSTFPLTITDVGILFRGTKERGVVIKPIINGGEFPRKLEPRTSFTAYLHPEALHENKGHSIRCVYALTDCGVMVKGNSPALKQLSKESGVKLFA